MASLYELTYQAKALQDLLESGEIDETVFNDTLEGLDIDTKIENICKVIRNMEADAKAFKEEKDRLAQRQKTAENGVARLKESLLNYLIVSENKNVDAGTFKVSYRETDKLNVQSEDNIPAEYLIPQPPKVDSAGLKKYIKMGAEVDGVIVEKSPYVTIR